MIAVPYGPGAVENGEGQRVASLMYEHAYSTKASIHLGRKTWRAGQPESAAAQSDSESGDSQQN